MPSVANVMMANRSRAPFFADFRGVVTLVTVAVCGAAHVGCVPRRRRQLCLARAVLRRKGCRATAHRCPTRFTAAQTARAEDDEGRRWGGKEARSNGDMGYAPARAPACATQHSQCECLKSGLRPPNVGVCVLAYPSRRACEGDQLPRLELHFTRISLRPERGATFPLPATGDTLRSIRDARRQRRVACGRAS
jgi:hypothetical protein